MKRLILPLLALAAAAVLIFAPEVYLAAAKAVGEFFARTMLSALVPSTSPTPN